MDGTKETVSISVRDAERISRLPLASVRGENGNVIMTFDASSQPSLLSVEVVMSDATLIVHGSWEEQQFSVVSNEKLDNITAKSFTFRLEYTFNHVCSNFEVEPMVVIITADGKIIATQLNSIRNTRRRQL